MQKPRGVLMARQRRTNIDPRPRPTRDVPGRHHPARLALRHLREPRLHRSAALPAPEARTERARAGASHRTTNSAAPDARSRHPQRAHDTQRYFAATAAANLPAVATADHITYGNDPIGDDATRKTAEVLLSSAASCSAARQISPASSERPRGAPRRRHYGRMTDAAPDVVPTVWDRLAAAGVHPQRIEWHLGAGRVELDGEVVTQPDHPAPRGTRLVLVPS